MTINVYTRAVFLLMSRNVTADGGTEAVTGGHGDNNICCISDDVILRLAKLGVKVLLIPNLYLLTTFQRFWLIFLCSEHLSLKLLRETFYLAVHFNINNDNDNNGIII